MGIEFALWCLNKVYNNTLNNMLQKWHACREKGARIPSVAATKWKNTV